MGGPGPWNTSTRGPPASHRGWSPCALDPKGTGLGLPICREIAHAHQGSLSIEDPGKGTCLVLRMPRID
ncbi:ATP-binding protein [Nonomuraea fuscirosea]|uniref:ATP-binding protein n=1 Tax=Nonomuraea fuscirosea TaxID=1291556 RepID=UPI00343138BC